MGGKFEESAECNNQKSKEQWELKKQEIIKQRGK
jgi:hypothetical protein